MALWRDQEEPPESLLIILMTAEAAFNRLTEPAEESEDSILELEDNALEDESVEIDENSLPLSSFHGLRNSSLVFSFESDIGCS